MTSGILTSNLAIASRLLSIISAAADTPLAGGHKTLERFARPLRTKKVVPAFARIQVVPPARVFREWTEARAGVARRPTVTIKAGSLQRRNRLKIIL
jgi:hypothetical protein